VPGPRVCTKRVRADPELPGPAPVSTVIRQRPCRDWVRDDRRARLDSALNEPPQVEIRRPRAPATVGSPVAGRLPGGERRREIRDHRFRGAHEDAERFNADHEGQGVVLAGACKQPEARRSASTSWDSTAPGSLGYQGVPGVQIARPPRTGSSPRHEDAQPSDGPCGIAFKVSRGRVTRSRRVSTRAGIVFSRGATSCAIHARCPGVGHRDEPGTRRRSASVREVARGRWSGTSLSAPCAVHQHATSDPRPSSSALGRRTVRTFHGSGVPASFDLRADACHAAVARKKKKIRGPVDRRARSGASRARALRGTFLTWDARVPPASTS
jgi:hypothetical protein